MALELREGNDIRESDRSPVTGNAFTHAAKLHHSLPFWPGQRDFVYN